MLETKMSSSDEKNTRSFMDTIRFMFADIRKSDFDSVQLIWWSPWDDVMLIKYDHFHSYKVKVKYDWWDRWDRNRHSPLLSHLLLLSLRFIQPLPSFASVEHFSTFQKKEIHTEPRRRSHWTERGLAPPSLELCGPALFGALWPRPLLSQKRQTLNTSYRLLLNLDWFCH